jgi:Mrp family chromosome partitioning ATPase
MAEQIIEQQDKPRGDADINHRILVMSGKGGVGKTTIAVNLALSLSMAGVQVGILDADLHGPNVPKMLGMSDSFPVVAPGDDGLLEPARATPKLAIMSMDLLMPDKDQPVIWRGPMKMKAIEQLLRETHWGKLEYLVVDLPPGTGDESLSAAQLTEADAAIIVTTPQEVALLDSRKAITFAKELKIPNIGVIENMSGMSCPHCGEEIELFGKGGGERAAGEMGVKFIGRIPIYPQIVANGDSGKPPVLDGEFKGKFGFDKITKEIEKMFTDNGGEK